MLAIPIFRSRVAPVLNWCSRILILPGDAMDSSAAQEVVLGPSIKPFERLKFLHDRGVRMLICGALSPDLLGYAESLGLQIIHGVSGNVADVLSAYRNEQLDQPRFWLPGCRCQRRYRGKNLEVFAQRSCDMAGGGRGQGKGGGRAQGGGRGRSGGARGGGQGAGPGGTCSCPQCGAKRAHDPGIPCVEMRCPECGAAMVRGQ